MDNNQKKNSPLSSTTNSKNEVKTVYINDIESLNDSTDNNDISYFPIKSEKINNKKIKGKISNVSVNCNLLTNKSENNDLTKSSLIQIKKIKKEKINKENNNNNNNNKNPNINLSNKEELIETKNVKKNKFISKYPNEFNKNKNKINNLIIEDNNIIKNNNSNLNINQNSEKEIEMLKEIDFLKKEIKLKDEIIKKLIEENKKLIEKIKIKEIDLLHSKNNEENLTKAIQENNKCISILNELILKYIPQNNNNKENINYNKLQNNISKSKIDKIDHYIPNMMDSQKQERKYNNNTTQFYNNIQLNKEINILPNGKSVQRYFKLHTRNKIKKNISKNFNKQINKYSFNDSKDKDKDIYLNMKEKTKIRNEKLKRNNTMGLDIINCNNNNNSDLNIINGGLNYVNNQLMKSSTNNNILKKKAKKKYIRYNLHLFEDNNSDYNNDYFSNVSCKNVNIDKKMDNSMKKFDNNFSLKENFSFNNINNNHVSSNKINDIKEKKFEIVKNYNLKYFKKLNSSNIEKHYPLIRKLKYNKNVYLTDVNINDINEKSFMYKNKTKNPKYEFTNHNNMIIKEKNKFLSPNIRGFKNII